MFNAGALLCSMLGSAAMPQSHIEMRWVRCFSQSVTRQPTVNAGQLLYLWYCQRLPLALPIWPEDLTSTEAKSNGWGQGEQGRGRL